MLTALPSPPGFRMNSGWTSGGNDTPKARLATRQRRTWRPSWSGGDTRRTGPRHAAEYGSLRSWPAVQKIRLVAEANPRRLGRFYLNPDESYSDVGRHLPVPLRAERVGRGRRGIALDLPPDVCRTCVQYSGWNGGGRGALRQWVSSIWGSMGARSVIARGAVGLGGRRSR